MGLLGGLFGGGTKVTQQAANTTEVQVDIGVENVIDMTPIAKILEWLGLKEAETAAATNSANAASASEIVTALKEVAVAKQAQEKAYLDKALPWLKAMAAAAILFLLTKTYRNWK